ncbi:MAG TPA: GAF domain-containing protein, partial [Gemmatimonadaceae bacterium]|nr:GAF domain-containing protein [Gemmatimonadaceae bacterium]
MTVPTLLPADGPLAEPGRLAALHASGLLDAPPAEILERLTAAASCLLAVPVLLVSLVDDHRQWFAGMAGLTDWPARTRQTPLSYSFCQHVVTARAPLVVRDATEHLLVRDNLAVVELGVRAYAGVPLTTTQGLTLGAFCAADLAPHDWQEREIELLRELARVAMTEIERRIERGGGRAEEDRVALAVEGAGEGVWDWRV